MKKLIACSIYAPSKRNKVWYDLQLNFLKETVKDFDHAVFCNQVNKEDFPESVIVGELTRDEYQDIWENHIDKYLPEEELTSFYKYYHLDIRIAYMRILEYFRNNPYENYLMMDSDCFPITNGWMDVLLSKMGKKWYAAPVRAECFEDYPHMSCIFVKGEHIHKDIMDFYPRKYRNLYGDSYREFGSREIKIEHDGEYIWYPLLRSNVVNVHPVRAAVYNHLFYHHVKGSHDHFTPSRPTYYNYFDHYMTQSSHVTIADVIYKDLVSNPKKFIESLCGDTYLKMFNQ